MSLEDVEKALAGLGSELRDAVILGMGNDLNGDDGVGPYLVSELVRRGSRIRAIDVGMLPENFTKRVAEMRPSAVVIIDAAYFDGPPGTVEVVEAETVDQIIFTTHHIPLSYTVQRLEAMCGCPVLVIGIRPECLETGAGITPAVQAVAEELARVVIDLEGKFSGKD